MQSRITKFLSGLFCLLFFLSLTATEVFAIPTVTGRVVLAGTGAALPNVWVKWMEDYGTPYQDAYRFARTDSNGNYSFVDLSTLAPGQLSKVLVDPIDTNTDGSNDQVEVHVDAAKPIPNASSGADALFHFNAANSPHAFTAIVPAGLSGVFSLVDNISLNDAASSMTLPDIIFTPASVAATPTPAPIYRISGKVFKDNDQDGVKDLLEGGFAGATVNLTGASTATVTTDSNGNYTFPNLYAGSYTVAVVVPIGYSVTTPTSTNLSLTGDQTVNFGFAKAIIGAGCTASITGNVYNDLNWNGNLDSKDTPIANWSVHLSAPGLATPLTVTTNSSGAYTFSNLCTNIFTITQTIPPPWFSTKSFSIVMSVVDGNSYTNANFFVAQQFNISGRAFLDTNGDGIITAGSKGYKGVNVILIGTTASGSIFKQSTTPNDGSYSFTSLPVGDYKLLFGQIAGYRSTTANAVNVSLNNNQLVNYGLTPASILKAGGACSNSTLDIVMIIDHSTSMGEPDLASGRPKIDEALEAANTFVDIIMRNLPSAKIGIVQFSGSQNYDVSNTGPDYLSSLLLPLTNDTNQLHSIISAITLEGGTCVQCGVQIANKALAASTRANSQKMIIFMTDGLANHTADTPGSVVDPYYAENSAMVDIIDGINKQNIVYNTIGVGKGGTGAGNIDEEFLKAIADTNWGSYYNDPTNGDLQSIFKAIAASSVPTGSIIGMSYEDKDLSATYTTGDKPIANMPITLAGTNLTKAVTTTTDSLGNYGFYGLCDSNGKNYTVTQNTVSPWLLTTSGSYTLSVAAGATYRNNNFGNRYGYKISGIVFNDINKNQLKDSGESGYTGGISISATSGTVSTQASGSYSVNGLLPGTYVVSYTSPLPKGYILIYPKNGPPPSFSATVGPACSADTATGASCGINGDISGLNFSISNSIPWFQTYGLDMRFDNGFTDLLPASTTCGGGSYASGTDSTFSSPGIIFSGDSSNDFGQGQSSKNNWEAGGILYPEVYNSNSPLKTATQNLLAMADKAGITINSLDAVPGCQSPSSHCNLNGLSKGFYHTTGDLKIDSNAGFSSGNYVIIADGAITITNGANISVTQGATAIFAAGKDIIIDSSIHASSDVCPVSAGQLQGIFSANRNVIIQGNNGDCLSGADKMLNIEGAVIANASRNGGSFQNRRDLCGNNPSYPSFTIKARPDFILNTPGFITQQQTVSHEETP